jgi:release factor glutamine methyltransferase
MEIRSEEKSDYKKKLKNIKALLESSQLFISTSYQVKKSGLDIWVFKNVFSPGYFDDSEYFADNMVPVEGLNVLEIGTGSGLIAIKMAINKAKRVVATDINADAVNNAAHNVKALKQESTIELRQGYIFRPVAGEKFDVIFWNIPFCYLDAGLKQEIGLQNAINDLEKSVFNPYYNFLHDYLNEGFDHLMEQGRLLLGFSPTIGRADVLEDIVRDLGLTKTVVREHRMQIKDDIEILQILEFHRTVS